MENIDIKYLITALADNEIEDQETRDNVLSRINSDRSLRYDYYVQQSIKSLLSGMKRSTAPPGVRKKVLRMIRPVTIFNRSFTYPQAWVFAISAAIILAIAALILSKIFALR